ncbi:uncharacterized protein GIQ15_01803 [Arthroderma uncinatum]|uniref:uncharacterized protein n=1 Tax=Arthroderma uncinatum TaxID=74035 RepID=UPI00144A6602|nr:uncharacterized protein GIQ15_01803 [Arthroderma uncinatum]KAF3492286.1 hypothetical protein GIQ15_01803 [Arthroderma uncinatum]
MNLTWPSAVSYSRADICLHDTGVSSLPEVKDTLTLGKHEGLDSFPETTAENEIRLLRLLPDQDDGPIHGDLQVSSLKSASPPSYQALSYTSSDEPGDTPTRNCPVYIGPYWDIIYVTKNCEDGLRAIRYQGTELPVWVDSVCINQQDAADKTQQVGLMNDIYAKAFQVTVFVGNPSPDSDRALKLLNLFANGSLVSSRVAATEEKSQTALKSLFQRRCFSRLWVSHETVAASRLEILCGQRSGTCPCWSSLPNVLRNCVPPWLFKLWKEDIRTDISGILHHAITHECSDPRDKIFAGLGLLNESEISPDYNLPVEVIYTGITAYLLKNRLDFRPLNLLGTGSRRPNLPSWVPDWSQPLDPSVRVDLEFNTKIDNGTEHPFCVYFPFSFDTWSLPRSWSGHAIDIDANGSLVIPALKICDISPTDKVLVGPDHQLVIALDRSHHGTILVSQMDKEYQIGTDSIFHLHGFDRPVILRSHTGTNTYSFVSICGISLSRPANGEKWYIPCDIDESNVAEIHARLSEEECTNILAFHARLLELCGAERAGTSGDMGVDQTSFARLAFLDFSILASANFRAMESRLRDNWRAMHEKLRWMFRDQAAVWKFIQDMDQGNQEEISGKDTMAIRQQRRVKINYTMEFPAEYSWDIRRFCWSFLRPATAAPKASDDSWNPVYKALKYHIADIQSWAKATEELMNAIDFSRMVLGSRWDVFPGIGLPGKWRSRWENFSKARGAGGYLPASEASNPECYWDWSEFEHCLEQRERLLDQTPPPSLTATENYRVKSHMLFKILGMQLDPISTVKIV